MTTEHLHFYLGEGVIVSDEVLQQVAERFEQQTLPALTKLFGPPLLPGIDGDQRFSLLLVPLPSSAGYFSSTDEYPRAIRKHSNERHVIYLNANVLQAGTPALDAILAHEVAHALQWQQDQTEESWLDEGLAELAAEIAGYSFSPFPRPFLENPDVPLLHWRREPADTAPNYGAAYLFLKYLREQVLSPAQIRTLVADQRNGYTSLESLLRELAPPRSFDDLFQDWVVANLLGEGQGPYRYRHLAADLQPRMTTLPSGGTYQDAVSPYGADYLRIPADRDWLLTFQGEPVARLISTEIPSGTYFWWSQRGDGADSRLTRTLDLTGLSQATLTYRLWYDLEGGWDYGYVAVSVDGGVTWKALPGGHTTEQDPLAHSYGPGYTGRSGGGATARWVEERIDLSDLAGRVVILRFEVITDEAVNGPGLALDDLAVPELGWQETAEEPDAGWVAEGFVRTENQVPVRFVVRLVDRDGAPEVREVVAAGEARGEVSIARGARKEPLALVVSALAPLAEAPVPYQVLLTPAAP